MSPPLRSYADKIQAVMAYAKSTNRIVIQSEMGTLPSGTVDPVPAPPAAPMASTSNAVQTPIVLTKAQIKFQERYRLFHGIQSDEDTMRVAAEMKRKIANFLASTNRTVQSPVVLTKAQIKRLERFMLLNGLYFEEDTPGVAAAYELPQAANIQSQEAPKALSAKANMVLTGPIPSGENNVSKPSKRKRSQIDSDDLDDELFVTKTISAKKHHSDIRPEEGSD